MGVAAETLVVCRGLQTWPVSFGGAADFAALMREKKQGLISPLLIHHGGAERAIFHGRNAHKLYMLRLQAK